MNTKMPWLKSPSFVATRTGGRRPGTFRHDQEVQNAVKRHQAVHEDELLAESDLGSQILQLRIEKENLLDTVWLATACQTYYFLCYVFLALSRNASCDNAGRATLAHVAWELSALRGSNAGARFAGECEVVSAALVRRRRALINEPAGSRLPSDLVAWPWPVLPATNRCGTRVSRSRIQFWRNCGTFIMCIRRR